MQKMAYIILFLLAFTQCNTCDNCKPIAEEPFIKIRFYNKVDSTKHVVIIDSINHKWAGRYSNFQDTVNTYQLPLNMNEDVSNFVISYRDTADIANHLTNTLSITYQRAYLKRTDNNIIQQNRVILSDVTSDFEKFNLLCGDSLQLICITNEALFQVYR